MKFYKLFLLRHGQSEGNARRIYQGQADFPLTELGRAQAQALALRWQQEGQRFDKIFASPLQRAFETAEIIAAALGLPVTPTPLLKERHNGSYEGRSQSSLNLDEVQPGPYYGHYEEAESDWELFLRTGQVLNNLLSEPPGAYLIVSHGGFLNQLVYAILGITPQGRTGPRFRFANTGFAAFSYAPEYHTWYVLRMNDTGHLQSLKSEAADE